MESAVEAQLIFQRIETVVEKAINFRRELGVRLPELLTPGELQLLQDRLDHCVDGGLRSVQQRSNLRPRSGLGASSMLELQNRASSIKARIKQKLAVLSLEAKIGMHGVQKPGVA